MSPSPSAWRRLGQHWMGCRGWHTSLWQCFSTLGTSRKRLLGVHLPQMEVVPLVSPPRQPCSPTGTSAYDSGALHAPPSSLPGVNSAPTASESPGCWLAMQDLSPSPALPDQNPPFSKISGGLIHLRVPNMAVDLDLQNTLNCFFHSIS